MEKRCTIKTIAQHLGVATSTVSRAFRDDPRISDEVKGKVLAAAAELHYVPNRVAARLNQRELRIGVLLKNVYPIGFGELLRGIDDGFRSLSDYKISYHTERFDETEETEEECRMLFEKFAVDDAIIAGGVLGQGMINGLSRFSENGCPVVLLQAGANLPQCLFHSMHDPVITAGLAAGYLADALRFSPHRRVLLFTGDQAANVHSIARDTFTEAAQSLGLTVAGVHDMGDDEAALARILTTADLSAVDGLYITSGYSLPLCRVLEERGEAERIVLVTSDVFPELVPYLLRRTVNATIYQNMYKQGYNAFVLLVEHLLTGCQVSPMVSPNPELVLPANVALYSHP